MALAFCYSTSSALTAVLDVRAILDIECQKTPTYRMHHNEILNPEIRHPLTSKNMQTFSFLAFDSHSLEVSWLGDSHQGNYSSGHAHENG